MIAQGRKRCLWALLPACLVSTPLWAADVDIASKPLFVTAGVEPNIIASIDDSGSMDSEVLMPTNDGALWWRNVNASFVGLDNNNQAAVGTLNYNRDGGAVNGAWQKTTYLFPNGTGTGKRVYSDNTRDHFAIPPFAQFAFARSVAYNGMYYDPTEEYAPWPSAGVYTFTDVSPAAAPSDPVSGSSTFDLTSMHRDIANNEKFRLHNGMAIPAGSVTYNGAWSTIAADTPSTGGSASVAVEYYPATYYVRADVSQSYTLTDASTSLSVSGSCATPIPAHYLIIEQLPSALGGVDALAYDGGCLQKVEIIDDGRSFASGRSYADEMQNFANWWSYYRKRHLATRAGLGLAFEATTGVRMGALTINSRSLRGMYSLTEPAERASFFDFIYGVDGNGGGTPNRQTLKFIGDQFNNTSGVITESCQQNFALLFTDGFTSPNTSSGVGNADSSLGSPFADSHSNTIADIASRYYENTLRSGDFDSGNVPVPAQCDLATPSSQLDCNADLHMVTYGITLGAQGTIFGNSHVDVEDAHTAPPLWQNPTANRNPVQVDDLFHAAVNTRGEMLNAQSAIRLKEVLNEALLDIVDRTRQSGTSSSTSAAILQEDTLLYSVAFRSDNWSGDLVAQEVSTEDGSLQAQAWSANELLTARNPATRNLLTHDGSSGTDFQLAALAPSQRDRLNINTTDVDDGLGAERLEWLRGEATAGMRDRTTSEGRAILGDMVNSTPLYIGAPNRGYSLLPAEYSPGTYGSFLNSIRNRAPIMAVGANDGFLHAFDGETGAELFAYMPSELLEEADGQSYARTSLLTDPGYVHRFFVDGSPSVNDVLIGSNWTTVMVGSMGVGGRSIFAIDVTDPENVDAGDVMWEFSDPDMGFGVDNVQIVPMPDGSFAAVFGNGYNSDNDRAFLFVVDIEDGSLLAKIDTGIGSSTLPNGLAPVVASSWPQLNFVTQYIYAGDLLGNLWRFDVTGAASTDWDTAQRVFTATDSSGVGQPITVQPRLSLNPERSGELIINFGTGSFFRDQDDSLTNPQVQTLYGIREALGTTPFARADLLQQEIIWEDTVTALGETRIVRQISENAYSNTEENGWFMDLVYSGNNVGERVISPVTFPSGNRRERVRFTSMTPSDDPCSAGRLGFIFDLDLFTGGATSFSVFDINDDGFFNVDDLVDLKTVNAISGGRGERLTVIRNQSGTGDFFYDGMGGRIGNSAGAEGLATGDPIGRQSWQQLR